MIHAPSLRIAAALALFALPLLARQAFSPAPWLVRAADANGDGDVQAAEWAGFQAELPSADGGFARPALLARGLFRTLDQDADGRLTWVDLQRIRDALDRDADGRLTAAETLAASPGGAGSLPFGERLLGGIAAAAADGDGDGTVSSTEWAALEPSFTAEGGALPLAALADWIARASAASNGSGDRNAMNAGVVLLGLDAELDADRDGRVTAADLARHFDALDTDRDGRASAAELAPPRRGPGRGAWTIRPDRRAARPLMPWQRDLADALALQARTGMPLLLCANIDGEAASEMLAWDRYRDPEFAALADGFICMIVSPDRRVPRDTDDHGRRIPDPRFGRVVNSEAIDNEPELYARYFDGRRVAPRHVGIAPDGTKLFDIYLVQDLSIVEDALREHGRPDLRLPAPADEAGLLGSPDARDRDLLEARFADGDERTRARLASLALSPARATQHPALLAMALRDPSAVVRGRAVWNLIQSPELAPAEDFVAAFREGDATQRTALVDALARARDAARDAPRRARLDRLQRIDAACLAHSSILDVERWKLVLGFLPRRAKDVPSAGEFDHLADTLDALLTAVDASPTDARLRVHAAAARMRFALVQLAKGRDPRFLFEDVVRDARVAAELAPDDGRAHAYLAWATYLLADFDGAAAHAARALPLLFEDAGSDLALEVLDVQARSHVRTLYAEMRAGPDWDARHVTEARAAYEVLLAHPAADEAQVVSYLDFLGQIEDQRAQRRVAEAALSARPRSGRLHDYERFIVLRDAGAAALTAAYADLVAGAGEADTPAVTWYAGLAELFAGLRHAEDGRADEALDAQARGRALLARAAELDPGFTDWSDHYVALAWAATARLRQARAEWEPAFEAAVTALRTRPASVDAEEGLGPSPGATARELSSALRQAGLDELAGRLRAELDALGPDAPVPSTEPAE